jgi:hypothetical protein
MAFDDVLFYVLDVVILIMMIQWTRTSQKVKIHTKQGLQWLVPVIFVAVAVIGWFRYSGLFQIVQTIALIVFAGMYYFLKSGLSEEGIVINGSLTQWEDAGKVTLDKKNNCITFRLKRRDANMYFKPEQLEEIRKFLADKAVKR